MPHDRDVSKTERKSAGPPARRHAGPYLPSNARAIFGLQHAAGNGAVTKMLAPSPASVSVQRDDLDTSDEELDVSEDELELENSEEDLEGGLDISEDELDLEVESSQEEGEEEAEDQGEAQDEAQDEAQGEGEEQGEAEEDQEEELQTLSVQSDDLDIDEDEEEEGSEEDLSAVTVQGFPITVQRDEFDEALKSELGDREVEFSDLAKVVVAGLDNPLAGEGSGTEGEAGKETSTATVPGAKTTPTKKAPKTLEEQVADDEKKEQDTRKKELLKLERQRQRLGTPEGLNALKEQKKLDDLKKKLKDAEEVLKRDPLNPGQKSLKQLLGNRKF